MGVLFLFIDAAQFLLSTLQLLLTRILPLIALLVGSLLLHLFRLIVSFLLPNPVVKLSSKASFLRRRRAAQGAAMAASDGSNFFPLVEEPYEDCLDADDPYFVEQQRLLMRQYEEAANGGVADDHFFSPEEDLDDVLLQAPVKEVSMLARGDAAPQGLLHFSSRARPIKESPGFQIRPEENDRTRANDRPAESTAPTSQSALVSQGSLFPSDLPPSLDHVIDAAAGEADTSGALPIRRTLPPTFSDVQRAVQDLNSAAVASPNTNMSDVYNNMQAAPTEMEAEHQPPVRSASFNNFVLKFRHHFRLDGH